MKRIGRREFIKTGTLASIGVGLGSLSTVAAASMRKGSRIRRYSTPGQTGMHMSDISFGSDRLSNGQEDLVHLACDLGINYFDTADNYGDGDSEATLGRALRGKRHQVFLASKTGAWPDTKRQAIMLALEGSLKRLNTDYIDVYFNHAVNDLERLKN